MNVGHGHVVPRPDGALARCGGPAICPECRADAEELDRQAVHCWFGLSYANYLVLPRLVLQSMPGGWQRRFVELLREADQRYGPHLEGDYCVKLRGEAGRFVADPLADYRHGRLPE